MKFIHWKKASALLLAMSMLLGGCGRNAGEEEQEKEEEVAVAEGVISEQTSSIGIDSNAKDFEEQLTDNSFYIVHEGIYYPLYTYHKNDLAQKEATETVDQDRMVFYSLESYDNIPTLFPGDHLVYYSASNMLDVITWERYKPLGATFGIYNLARTTGGRYYLDFSENDAEAVVPGNSLEESLYGLSADTITVDKIGGIAINDDVVSDGIIVGATLGRDYDIEFYTGTYYEHFTAKADTYAFQAYELFASTSSETLQERFWEVNIPEYFVNGYYDINGMGMVRIMREPSYSIETEFSEQLLFPNEVDSDSAARIRLYSEVEDLNKFTQEEHPDKLGYVDPDGDKETDVEIDEETGLPEAANFKEANIKEFDLWFPEGKLCRIEIKSKKVDASTGESAPETTGSAMVKFDTGGTTAVTYNRFDEVYVAEINGKGNSGTLTISGFWFDYDVNLTNIEIYEGQDLSTEPVDSASTGREEVQTEEEKGGIFDGAFDGSEDTEADGEGDAEGAEE